MGDRVAGDLCHGGDVVESALAGELHRCPLDATGHVRHTDHGLIVLGDDSDCREWYSDVSTCHHSAVVVQEIRSLGGLVMRVFVTGASGHVGSAVIPELLDAGHDVVGLARSDESAAAVTATGAKVLRGSLDDLDGLREAAMATDGVIHLAFKHEAMRAG